MKRLGLLFLIVAMLCSAAFADQYTLEVPNGSGYQVRTGMNNAHKTLATNNSGASAPTTTFAYMLWADTSAGKLKQRNATDTDWIIIWDLPTGKAANASTLNGYTSSTTSAANVVPVTGSDGKLSSGFVADTGIRSGDKVLFVQASCPPGWTQDTASNDVTLRLVSGAGGGTGGSLALSSANTGGHSLTGAETGPHTHTGTTASGGSHTHSMYKKRGGLDSTEAAVTAGFVNDNWGTGETLSSGSHTHTFTSDSSGSGTAHTHPLNLAYKNVIICTKN